MSWADGSAPVSVTYECPADMGMELAGSLCKAILDLGRLAERGALGGVWAIMIERLAQLDKGYDAAHDDLHDLAWLGDQAAVRASAGEYADAGALCAAQLDRMQRFDEGGH